MSPYIFHRPYIIILLLLSALSSPALMGQTEMEELQKKKKALEEEIRYTNKLLSQTSRDRQASLSQLQLLDNNIKNRQQLINTLNSEIRYLNREISKNTREIKQLNHELEQLKEEYARMIYHAYKTRSRHHRLMFIFSSEDFNQAYRRMRYYKQYGDYRRKQAALIVEKREALAEKNAQLKQDTEERAARMGEREQERQQLREKRTNQNETIEELKSKEQELQREIDQKQEQARALDQEIQRAIAEATRAAEHTDETEAHSFALTPEQVELSEDFASNKGRLPWPTHRGVITSHFGRRRHDGLSNIEIENSGVTIQTSQNAQARAVFSGEVKKVLTIGGRKAVLVQHGKYFTLYDNLATVVVTPGQYIQTGDIMGTLRSSSDANTAELNFQVWEARKRGTPEKHDPQHWLLPR